MSKTFLFATSLFLFGALTEAHGQGTADRFTGSWTGSQQWKVDSPSAYGRAGQTVSLTIGTLGGKINGLMTPFLGGEEGASFTDARIVGNQLRATGVIGLPRAANDESDWKPSVGITFVFTVEGNNLVGTANLTLGDVPWLKLEYRLTRS